MKYLFSHYLDFNINKLADDTGIEINNKIIEPYNNYNPFATI